MDMLDASGEPIVEIKSKNSIPVAATLPADEFGGFQNKIFLSKSAKVMFTRNLWSENGVCNGSIGIVKDIVFQSDQSPPCPPLLLSLSNFINFLDQVSIIMKNV